MKVGIFVGTRLGVAVGSNGVDVGVLVGVGLGVAVDGNGVEVRVLVGVGLEVAVGGSRVSVEANVEVGVGDEVEGGGTQAVSPITAVKTHKRMVLIASPLWTIRKTNASIPPLATPAPVSAAIR